EVILTGEQCDAWFAEDMHSRASVGVDARASICRAPARYARRGHRGKPGCSEAEPARTIRGRAIARGTHRSESMVTVRFQPTPNPNAGKFTVDRPVVDGPSSKSFYSPEQAGDEPVAAALFSIDGVEQLFMVDDFITVTKRPDAGWDRLVPEVISAIERSMT